MFKFQFKGNPASPPVVVPTEQEAEEMRKHPEYEEVIEERNPARKQKGKDVAS